MYISGGINVSRAKEKSLDGKDETINNGIRKKYLDVSAGYF